MKIVLLFLFLTLVGSLAAGFLLSIASGIEPERVGMANRLVWFSLRYGIFAGAVAAGLFLWFYRRSLRRSVDGE